MSVSRQLLRPTVTPLPAALNFLSWRVPTGEGGREGREEKRAEKGVTRYSLLFVLLVTRVTRYYSCYSLLVLLVLLVTSSCYLPRKKFWGHRPSIEKRRVDFAPDDDRRYSRYYFVDYFRFFRCYFVHFHSLGGLRLAV